MVSNAPSISKMSALEIATVTNLVGIDEIPNNLPFHSHKEGSSLQYVIQVLVMLANLVQSSYLSCNRGLVIIYNGFQFVLILSDI